MRVSGLEQKILLVAGNIFALLFRLPIEITICLALNCDSSIIGGLVIRRGPTGTIESVGAYCLAATVVINKLKLHGSLVHRRPG